MSKIYTANSITDRFRRTFIGDRQFYKAVLALVIPIIVQNMITNFVNLLDNMMVGQVGTVEMSGVAIANQLLFVFNLAIFGALAGPGIFGAQFFGAGDEEGLKNTFRFKVLIAAVVLAVGTIVLIIGKDSLISLYLKGEGDPAEAAQMLKFGREYLMIMLTGLLPFALTQVYSTSLRETGETMLPMKASIVAVLTNLCLNYILIFGKLGFPAMGVHGAAVATVISRYAELAVIIIYTYRHIYKYNFLRGAFRTLKVPLALASRIMKKGLPLLVNEFLWALGMTTLVQIFSTKGLNVVAGLNISSTISHLFNVVFYSMGAAVSVMAGQALGSGEIKKAKGIVWKLIFFSASCCIVLGGMLIAASKVIPDFYNTTADVKKLASHFMVVSAVYMPIFATTHCCYFTLRSGGKTFATFIFDSMYTWSVCVPFAYVLTRFTSLSIQAIYPVSYLTELIKCVAGILIIRTGFWAQNFVAEKRGDELSQ